jgi:hypothetical protein
MTPVPLCIRCNRSGSRAEQDIAIHCSSLDRARSRDKQWERRRQQAAPIGDRARSPIKGFAAGDRGGGPWRARQVEAGSVTAKVVQFSLTEEEFDEVSEAAARSGLARGAFAAEVTLAAVRGSQAKAGSPLREALVELMSAAGLVRRVGTLNTSRFATVAGLTDQAATVRSSCSPPAALVRPNT